LPAPSLERDVLATTSVFVRNFFRLKLRGLSCEIVSDLCPNPFSHDWHVQPDCQRPNRLPPERRAFSPAGSSCVARALMPATILPLGKIANPHRQHPAVLETLQTYRAAKKPSTPATHRISTRFPHREGHAERIVERRTPRPPSRAKLDLRRIVEERRFSAASEATRRSGLWPLRDSQARNGMVLRS
jgi:hypothetical protein